MFLKCPYRQIFLLAILNLAMISILPVQKFFDLDESFVFYGQVVVGKSALSDGLCPLLREVWNEPIS